MHGHGSSSSEGVAADVIAGVAQVIEANVLGCIFQGGADGCGVYALPQDGSWVEFMCIDWCAWWTIVGHDVVNATSQ